MPVELAHDPLTLEGVLRELSSPEAGAVVIFVGRVRATEEGRPISGIRYEAYEGMAEKALQRAAREAGRRFGARVAARHRLGEVPAQEASLVVACAAAHRAEAFEAARWLVERIKQDIPIWKVDFT